MQTAPEFRLATVQGREIVESMRTTITERWSETADLSRLTEAEADQLWGRQILSPYIDYDAP